MLDAAPLLFPLPGEFPFSATWAGGLGTGPSDLTGETGGGLVGEEVTPVCPPDFALGFGFAFGLASTACAFCGRRW